MLSLSRVMILSESFFECFDDITCINNTIPCETIGINNNTQKLGKLATSYMFDNEDLKKDDVYPFDNWEYEMKIKSKKHKSKKPKNFVGRIAVMATSAVMLLGGSWTNSILY